MRAAPTASVSRAECVAGCRYVALSSAPFRMVSVAAPARRVPSGGSGCSCGSPVPKLLTALLHHQPTAAGPGSGTRKRKVHTFRICNRLVIIASAPLLQDSRPVHRQDPCTRTGQRLSTSRLGFCARFSLLPCSGPRTDAERVDAHGHGREFFDRADHAPQSSSASRFTAGAAGLLLLIQCGERPEL
jgi:hypothetical protein